jgi:D-glycero-D-manno-heptose 1,7-bisphosphate phosphatase
MNKALFLDRDGVINVEKNYVYRIEDFQFIDGIFDVLKHYQNAGFLLIVVTNQAGIARGYYSEEDFHTLNRWMVNFFKETGIHITSVYYCPFHPVYGIGHYKQESFCRKPSPGMLLQAAQDYNINLSESLIIGDKESDIEAGFNAGIQTTVLVTELTEMKNNTKADFVINNISELLLCLDM